MSPLIDKRETGINLRRIMDKRGITAKDVQQYLGLGCVQSVYRWLDGINMPDPRDRRLYVYYEKLNEMRVA